jgi:hypothetical protein
LVAQASRLCSSTSTNPRGAGVPACLYFLFPALSLPSPLPRAILITDWDANGAVNSTDVSAFINTWFEDTAAGCG